MILSKKEKEVLKRKKVVVVGVGATGSASSGLMAKIGIGKLVIIDRDFVESSNLGVQRLYDNQDLGQSKAITAKRKLSKLNSNIKIQAFVEDLNQRNIEKLVDKPDLILDGTDNLETRFLINDYSLKNNIPWIYASAIKSRGATLNIIPNKTPCFQCVFKKPIKGLETCDTIGVIPSAITRSVYLQISEAVKILLNKRINPDLRYIDVGKNKIKNIKISKRKNCNACNGNFEFLDKPATRTVALCGKNSFHVLSKGKINLNDLAERLSKFGEIKKNKHVLHFSSKKSNFSVFRDGRAIIKNVRNKAEAKSIYSKMIGN